MYHYLFIFFSKSIYSFLWQRSKVIFLSVNWRFIAVLAHLWCKTSWKLNTCLREISCVVKEALLLCPASLPAKLLVVCIPKACNDVSVTELCRSLFLSLFRPRLFLIYLWKECCKSICFSLRKNDCKKKISTYIYWCNSSPASLPVRTAALCCSARGCRVHCMVQLWNFPVVFSVFWCMLLDICLISVGVYWRNTGF